MKTALKYQGGTVRTLVFTLFKIGQNVYVRKACIISQCFSKHVPFPNKHNLIPRLTLNNLLRWPPRSYRVAKKWLT